MAGGGNETTHPSRTHTRQAHVTIHLREAQAQASNLKEQEGTVSWARDYGVYLGPQVWRHVRESKHERVPGTCHTPRSARTQAGGYVVPVSAHRCITGSYNLKNMRGKGPKNLHKQPHKQSVGSRPPPQLQLGVVWPVVRGSRECSVTGSGAHGRLASQREDDCQLTSQEG